MVDTVLRRDVSVGSGKFVVCKVNSKVATVTLLPLQDHLLVRRRAICCRPFTFCSRSPHRSVTNLSLFGVSRGMGTACGRCVGRLCVKGSQNQAFVLTPASPNPVLTSRRRTPAGPGRQPESDSRSHELPPARRWLGRSFRARGLVRRGRVR